MRVILWCIDSCIRRNFSFKSKIKFYIMGRCRCWYLSTTYLLMYFRSPSSITFFRNVYVWMYDRHYVYAGKWDGRKIKKMILSNVEKWWGQKIPGCPPHSSFHNHSKGFRSLSSAVTHSLQAGIFLSSFFCKAAHVEKEGNNPLCSISLPPKKKRTKERREQ